MEIFLNGEITDLDGLYNQSELADAAYRSLFSWARAKTGDELLNNEKYGWWADDLSSDNDRYGSRLWLFLRSKITDDTIQELHDVCIEALDWMIKDKLATSVEVEVTRNDKDHNRLDVLINITQTDLNKLSLQFKDLWNGIL